MKKIGIDPIMGSPDNPYFRWTVHLIKHFLFDYTGYLLATGWLIDKWIDN